MIQNNTATSFEGGGLYQESEGSNFRASGNNTRDDRGNTAGQTGGGIVLFSGAERVDENGATCDPEQHSHKPFRRFVPRKQAQTSGPVETARGVEGNTAEQAGGGIVLFSGADVLIESQTALVIQNNTATSLFGSLYKARAQASGYQWLHA